MRLNKVFCVLLIVVFDFIAGCGSTAPLKLEDIDKNALPADVLKNPTAYQNRKVLWGGTIVSCQNLKQGTMIEILAYPLSANHKPDIKQQALGRIIVKHQDYLEAIDYAPGRIVSIVGQISEVIESKIGDADYHYPLIQAQQIHLWPMSRESESQFHFGLGVMIHN